MYPQFAPSIVGQAHNPRMVVFPIDTKLFLTHPKKERGVPK